MDLSRARFSDVFRTGVRRYEGQKVGHVLARLLRGKLEGPLSFPTQIGLSFVPNVYKVQGGTPERRSNLGKD